MDDPGGCRRNTLAVTLLVLTVAGTLVLALSLEPIAQPLAYHDFADSRRFLGIDNFFNVASNLPFLIFGVSGLVYIRRARPRGARRSWTVFFSALAAVAFGSAWYHLAPDNVRLVWDRLPIAIGLAALFIALLAEHMSPALERLLIPVVVVSTVTVFFWHYTDDLRLYLWLQAFTLIGVVLFLLLFKPAFPGRQWILAAFALFMLAKLAEHYDAAIFLATRELVGGHTVKHLLAGLAPLAIQIMLMRRAGADR